MNATKRIYPVVFTLLILMQGSFVFAQEKIDESKIREEQAYLAHFSAAGDVRRYECP